MRCGRCVLGAWAALCSLWRSGAGQLSSAPRCLRTLDVLQPALGEPWPACPYMSASFLKACTGPFPLRSVSEKEENCCVLAALLQEDEDRYSDSEGAYRATQGAWPGTQRSAPSTRPVLRCLP